MLNPRVIQKVRLFIAFTVAILCVVGFLGIFYPIKIFDIELTPLLQRTITDFSIFAAILLALVFIVTFIFGRIYCSTVCPLGLIQELCLLIYHRKKLPQHKNAPYKYFIAAIAFGSLFGGTVWIIRLIDPYTIFGSALSGTIFGLVFLSLIAILTWATGRWFCTNICPVGTVLGLISRHARNKIYLKADSCVVCGLCAQKCPAGCIDFKNKAINNETCIKCFKCLTLCHNHGLYYGRQEASVPAFNPGRRRFLLGAAALAVFAAASKGGVELSKNIAKKMKAVILPAGAKSPERFANKCLNCNLCIESCPMKILKKANKEYPAVHIEYHKDFCEYDCHKCSEVCPSGAIKRLTLAEKQKTQIGIASINEDACIQCGLCVMECPRKIITKASGEFPQIKPDSCIGCGACQAVCPVSAIKVTAIAQQKTLNN